MPITLPPLAQILSNKEPLDISGLLNALPKPIPTPEDLPKMFAPRTIVPPVLSGESIPIAEPGPTMITEPIDWEMLAQLLRPEILPAAEQGPMTITEPYPDRPSTVITEPYPERLSDGILRSETPQADGGGIAKGGEIDYLYHGTSKLAANKIKKEGFKLSREHGGYANTMEEYVSLTDDLKIAKNFADVSGRNVDKVEGGEIIKIDKSKLKIANINDTYKQGEGFGEYIERMKKDGWDVIDATEDKVSGYIGEGEREFILLNNNVSKLSPKEGGGIEGLQEELKGEYGIDLRLRGTQKGDLKLDHIVVPKGQRKQGIGSQVMKRVTDYADKNNLRIVLTTAVRDDSFGTTSASRLKTFYKRFGFVENKGKDYSISENMLRNPKPSKLSPREDKNKPTSKKPTRVRSHIA